MFTRTTSTMRCAARRPRVAVLGWCAALIAATRAVIVVEEPAEYVASNAPGGGAAAKPLRCDKTSDYR